MTGAAIAEQPPVIEEPAASAVPFEDGMQVMSGVRKFGRLAFSEYAACLGPLLNALNWTGQARHLSEAVPHFIDSIELPEFRETLANLNMVTVPIRTRHDRLNPALLPCLFVPDRGTVRVVLDCLPDDEGGGYRIYDGFTRSIRETNCTNLPGTAYAIKKVSGNIIQRDDSTWVAELLVKFRKLVVQVLIATLMINLFSLAMPLFMMAIYDVVIPSASIAQLGFLVGGVGLAIGIEWLFRKLRSQVMAYAAGRIDYLIGIAGFRQVLLLPIPMSENEPLGAQISHLQEFESVREFFAGPLGETIIDLPFVIISISVIALLSGWLVMVPITAAALLVLTAFAVAPFIKRTYANAGGSKTRQQRFLIEAVSGMRAIKFAGAEKVWIDRFRMLSGRRR